MIKCTVTGKIEKEKRNSIGIHYISIDNISFICKLIPGNNGNLFLLLLYFFITSLKESQDYLKKKSKSKTLL